MNNHRDLFKIAPTVYAVSTEALCWSLIEDEANLVNNHRDLCKIAPKGMG